MERVVKRFLLHNNRENEEIRESDFDELKQDMQMIRFEMLTNLNKTKEQTLKYMTMLHSGVSVLGDFMFTALGNTELTLNFKDFQLYENELNEHRKQITNRYQMRLNSEPARNSPHSVADADANKKTLLNIELKKNSLSNIRSDDEVFKSPDSLSISENLSIEKEQKHQFSFLDLNAIKGADEE